MAGTSLALPTAQKVLWKAFERSMRKSAAIVQAAQHAPDLYTVQDPETGEQRVVCPEGMTERQKRIAQHALLPAKSAPVYLTEAYRDYELAQKLAAAAGESKGSNTARTVVLVVEKPAYERVRVDREDAIDVEATGVNDG